MASFGILGPLRADVDGTGATPMLAPKQRVVLACLLLSANRIVPLATLIDALWGDDPPRTARITTQGYIKDLRRAFGDIAKSRIVTAEPGYLIVIDDGELDLNTFSQLRNEARAAALAGDWERVAKQLRAALELWRGEPLLDVASGSLQTDEVPALAETRLQALELRIDADLRLGRHAELAPELRRLVAAHPLREKFHAQLMLSLYRSGLQAEAMDSYHRVRTLLADELGVDPGPELRELRRGILAGDPALQQPGTAGGGAPPYAAVVPPRQLPAALPDFTGRAMHVKHLLDLVGAADGDRRAVVISALTGVGGVGKTALALYVAHQLADAFPDGQLHASLQGVAAPVDSGIVLARFLRDLGLPDAAIPPDEAGRAARYRTLMTGRRMLVVLDDAHNAAQVRPLLPGSPACAVIVTSRRAMPDLAGAASVSVDALSDDDARELFTVIVGPQRAMAEPDAVATVLGYCGGLPLAIRIAATRLVSRPGWSIASMARRLADERVRLNELAVGDVAVRSSFAVSYRALPGDGAARIFMLLGLAGTATVSLGVVAALAGWGQADAERALETLIDSHLAESVGAGRYRVHDLLRIYAAELAERELSSEQRRAAVLRMLEWYCQRAVAANRFETGPYDPPSGEPPVMFGTRQEAADWCEAERANLVAATRLAASLGMPEIAARIPAALWFFFQRRPYQGDWLVSHEIGLECARRTGDKYTEGFLLQSLGKLHARSGRIDDALRHLNLALNIRRERGDRLGEMRTLATIGHAYLAISQPETALGKLKRVLDMSPSVATNADTAIVCNNIGEACRQLRQYTEALPYLDRAILLFRQAGDRYGEGIAETTAGEVHEEMGQPEVAIKHYLRALAAHRDGGVGDVDGAYVLSHLARVYQSLGKSAEAGYSLRAALPVLDRLGDPLTAQIRAQLDALR